MKKLISALCALMLAVSLAACSRGPAEHGGLLPLDPTDPPATEEPTAAPTNPTQPPEPVELPNAGTLAALADDGAALCLCQWSRSGELEHSGMLDAAAVAAVLDAANAAQWVERKAPGVQEFSFDSYVTLSSQRAAARCSRSGRASPPCVWMHLAAVSGWTSRRVRTSLQPCRGWSSRMPIRAASTPSA